MFALARIPRPARLLAAIGAVLCVLVPHTSAETPTTVRVSVATDGTQGNGRSWGDQAISADGRYVAFTTEATNLVSGDTNGYTDIFVRDTLGGTTILASVSSDSVQGNYGGSFPSLSGDGRYITFSSISSNLVSGNYSDNWNVFVRDLRNGTTTCVSLGLDELPGRDMEDQSMGSAITPDGQFVAFSSTSNRLVANTWGTTHIQQIYLRNLRAGTTTLVSADQFGVRGDNASGGISISSDGRFVAFSSQAENLVSGISNGLVNVFVRDTHANTTICASITPQARAADGSSGQWGFPSLSADGRYVALDSAATDLVAGDTNGVRDVFVRDTATSTTERVSVATDGSQANGNCDAPSMSADGATSCLSPTRPT